MSKLPVLSALEVIKALSKFGFYVDHQTGSHIILRQNKEPFKRVTVPNHREVARGTLNGIIEDAGLTRDEFLGML
jgi:predicted RNA binding protein YcfA (HicA-like mRNA interferase family)